MGALTVQPVLSWGLLSGAVSGGHPSGDVECQRDHGIEVFDIEDDNFTFDQERAKRLMNLMLDRFGEGKLNSPL